MTAVRTAAQRGRSNQNRGKTAERAVATFFRGNGWPNAERAVVTGSVARGGDGTIRERPDPGDISGVLATIVSVKDCETERLTEWLAELDRMAVEHGEPAALRVLVHKRRGKADAGRWWAWLRADQYAGLSGGRTAATHPVRMELADLAAQMRRAGYAPSEAGAVA